MTDATTGRAGLDEEFEPVFQPYTAKADSPWQELAVDRARCPVAHSRHLNAVQITSYSGVKELLLKHEEFTGTYSTLWPLEQPLAVDNQVFSSADPPRHTRQRKLFIKAMSASRIGTLRTFSEELANRLVDDIIGAGECFDLASAYARRITEGHIAELLGLPESERERFLYLSGLFELSTADPASHSYQAEMREWQDTLARMVRERRQAGPDSDDLITQLCFAEHEGDRLAEGEVASLIRAMIRAGNTSTAAAIVNTVHALEAHPQQKARYLSDIDRLTLPLVHEGLRYDGPVLGLWRRCKRDTTIQDRPVRAGERVFTVHTAANHDPAVFEQSEEFVIDRDWSRLPSHLAFGYGIHHCIGMNLALLECEVALSTLYKRLPGLRLRPGFVAPQAPGPVVRNWLSLEMEYDREALEGATV
ncbi:hypothetical protein GCM10010300_68860 [Streptomyces olivaceoviridis]|uniref:cytochrome P450 n=1 Tax=Streptomyces olivaceoviridis TaxID=1921 RepID=UPI00167BAEF6|nr:cytochrome P450 [Streptomyces olivaceoviridis]GGZ15072.1 hypothetical protein GCM10010300_68860 [Streptomyces olivaceoviridis]